MQPARSTCLSYLTWAESSVNETNLEPGLELIFNKNGQIRVCGSINHKVFQTVALGVQMIFYLFCVTGILSEFKHTDILFQEV